MKKILSLVSAAIIAAVPFSSCTAYVYAADLPYSSGNVGTAAATYPDDMLGKMAKRYYAANNDGYMPEFADVTDDPDGSKAIQLYDIVDSHVATCTWYYIDNTTAKGVDLIGNPVDLSPYVNETIRTGVWTEFDYKYDYLIFEGDGVGFRVYQQDYTTIPFKYDIEADNLFITYFDDTPDEIYKIKESGSDYLIIVSESGEAIKYYFTEDTDREGFRFYTTDTLNEMAAAYFSSKSDMPVYRVTNAVNEYGLIIVAVYTDSSMIPAEEYKINRFTAEGEDSAGNYIDFNKNNSGGFGDANGDGSVDGRDASTILSIYADLSSGTERPADSVYDICDIDHDTMISGKDASIVLAYYADMSSSSEYIEFSDYVTNMLSGSMAQG